MDRFSLLGYYINKWRRECVSTNQRPGWPSWFSDQPEKHKLGRDRWDLASCQVSSISVQLFQRRSQKCFSQSEDGAAILFFRSVRKTQTWYRTLRSCFLSSFIEFCSAVSEKSKMYQPIRGRGGHLVFPIGSQNTNLVQDVVILLPDKFCWIPFSGFRGEVLNVSANQRPGRQSCFPIGPKHTNLVGDFEILLPVKFRWIPFSGIRGEVKNVKS